MSEDRKVIKAIAGCIGKMEKLGRENFNKFDKYKFTSIDDFLAATSKVCAEFGVVITQDERSFQTIERNGKQWLLMSFEFMAIHASGDSVGPFIRTVAVPFTGAQAFGSAQSYVLKAFLRSLFQIATGDQDDPDYGPTHADVPKVEKPEPLITDSKVQEIFGIAEKLACFHSQDAFESWILNSKGKEIVDLTQREGVQLARFLTESPNPEDWPSSVRDTLEISITETAG